jgi:purine-binding chemotaxis protein CheW
MQRFLLVRAAGQLCAIAAANVVEIMRPLPLRPCDPSCRAVTGLAVVRGQPLPVVELGKLLTKASTGSSAEEPVRRFVSLRTGKSAAVVLAVSAVVGLRELSPTQYRELPPLMAQLSPEAVAQIGVVDGEFFAVLEAARLLPADEGQRLATQTSPVETSLLDSGSPERPTNQVRRGGAPT